MRPDKRTSVLLVDDDARNRKLMELLIQAEGYLVRSVASGTAALAAVASETPGLILLDIMMPDMDGFEVLRRLKADSQTSRIPVIMVTALDDEASRMRLGAAGASRMLTKPIDRWALKACLSEFLGDEQR